MRQIIVDTETTGLEPSQGHRIIEIGCVEIVNRAVTGNHLHLYVNPERESDPEALAVHGLTMEFLADKPRFADVVDDFLKFIAGAELIAHNAAFDVKFFNAELARLGLSPIADCCDRITDSLLHARTLHPGKRNSLDALCDRYGISHAQRTLHGALLDSQLLAEVWLAMTRGQETLLIDLDQASSLPGGAGEVEGKVDARWLKVLPASAQELAEHEQYLRGLNELVGGDCMWRQQETLLQRWQTETC